MNYVLVNDNDGNDRIELTSTNENSAVVEALEHLGYTVFEIDDQLHE